MTLSDWPQLQSHIAELEQEGLVTRTFRRLDAERQMAVIHAVLDEASERGPTAINIKHVAERAGVAVGSLYTYFGSRDGMLDFAVTLCVRYMSDAFESFRPYLIALPFDQGLRLYLSGGVEWSQTQLGLIQFFARAAYHSDSELLERIVQPVATTMRELVRAMLEGAIARGEVRPDIDLDATSRLIHGLSIVAGDSQILPYLNAYFQITGGDVLPERVLDAFVALVMDGIAPRS
ncbi:MAG TPA: TetR/AcrR family transcriptional regulator [Aggregatilinea sp.]|uniref:TetR/AcrR family transcriptional regulator n=1 Tax=Aggregatilinea sp. TaxID=2806333 RepID=UPI002C1A2293|nr:TetR/AcrR family transcriptional regulator [Aggregatilinea sp.]HML22624.1 TetR/AcrR family transcriptional regulator [Aggregatilinea sp.]